MDNFALPLAGGLLLGLSAIWLLFSMGRIAGISGIAWGSLAGPDRGWRLLFLAGMALGGVATHWLIGQPIPEESGAPLWVIIASGLLVGWGTEWAVVAQVGMASAVWVDDHRGHWSPRSRLWHLAFSPS